MRELIKGRLSVIIALVLGTGLGWGMRTIIAVPEIRAHLIAI